MGFCNRRDPRPVRDDKDSGAVGGRVAQLLRAFAAVGKCCVPMKSIRLITRSINTYFNEQNEQKFEFCWVRCLHPNACSSLFSTQ